MFKSRYPVRGKHGGQPKPAWALEAEKDLLELGMSKTDLAALLDVNYAHMVCVISGSRVSPRTVDQIRRKIDELKGADKNAKC